MVEVFGNTDRSTVFAGDTWGYRVMKRYKANHRLSGLGDNDILSGVHRGYQS